MSYSGELCYMIKKSFLCSITVLLQLQSVLSLEKQTNDRFFFSSRFILAQNHGNDDKEIIRYRDEPTPGPKSASCKRPLNQNYNFEMASR